MSEKEAILKSILLIVMIAAGVAIPQLVYFLIEGEPMPYYMV